MRTSTRLQARRCTAISNQIRDRDRVVRLTVERIVDLADALLHRAHEGAELTETVVVCFAAFDAREGEHGIVEDPADVCGRLRGRRRRGAGEDLPDKR